MEIRPGEISKEGQAPDVERELEEYCRQHPGSPSAARRPQITIRGGTCIALLGKNVSDGIVGLGPTVQAALRAFDVQYLNSLRPPPGGTAPPNE